MPWQETQTVDERLKFVAAYMQQEDSMAYLCRHFGISRKTGYKWLERYGERGPVGLEDASRAPHHHPHQVEGLVVEALLNLRDAHPTWGPKKLEAVLGRREPGLELPARSTIALLLKRHGRVVDRKRRRRIVAQTAPFACCDSPNALWCVDFKGHFDTGDGKTCYPLTITDADSRYLLCCQGLLQTGLEHVRPIFETIFRQYGLPKAIRSDNGPPFASRTAGGLSRLSIWWLHLGIVHDRIEPGKPQQNGRHERMHLTLKNETAAPPASSFVRQQIRFNAFQQEYNEVRPHEALDMQTPGSRYAPSSRPFLSARIDFEYPDDWAIRKIHGAGVFTWKHQKMFIGKTLHGESIGLEPVDDRYWRAHLGPATLGVFDSWRRRMLRAAERRRLERKQVAEGTIQADQPQVKPPSAALQEASPAIQKVLPMSVD